MGYNPFGRAGGPTVPFLDPHRVRRLIEAGQPGMYSDGDGLFLRIREGCSAAWTFRHRFGGRDVWLPIGDATNVSLTIAQQAKRTARVLIDQGREAAEQRWTFSALAERWYEHPAAANDLLRYLKATFAFGRHRIEAHARPVADRNGGTPEGDA